jgi:nicotinate dehydrogenase subunit B
MLDRRRGHRQVAEGTARRDFLKGAGILVVGFSMAGTALSALSGTASAASGPAVPSDTQTAPELDSWLAVHRDGSVEIYQSKRELGTGVATAITQIAAEELSLPVSAVDLHTVDTLVTPPDGGTVGSASVSDGGASVRLAAATAYQALLVMAAKRFATDVSGLAAADGVIRGPDGRKVSYGDLVAGRRFHMKVDVSVPVKSYKRYKVVGTSVPRLDLPTKLTGAPGGTYEYLVNMRVPGMVHARFMRPPSYGARIVSMKTAAVKKMPGVVDVIELDFGPSMRGWSTGFQKNEGLFVAVLAHTEQQALDALTTLEADTKWTEASNLPNVNTAEAQGLYAKSLKPVVSDVEGAAFGDVPAVLKGAAKTVRQSYYTPWQINAPIGPSVAVADVGADRAVVYSATQDPFGSQATIAACLGMKNSQVALITYDGSGNYGRTGNDDVGLEAALLSQRTGRPVRVQWMRHEEFQWSPSRTPMAFDIQGGVDASGKILAWQSTVWSDSHVSGGFFGATYGGAILPPYEVKARKTEVHYVKTALRVSNMRGLGAYATIFSHESLIDELAHAAEKDPLEFRLDNLTDPRAKAVLEVAAKSFGYEPHVGPRGNGHGVGVSLTVDAAAGTYVGYIAEVRVDKATGQVTVPRISVAHDCGLMVNPNGVENQVQGGVIQSLSWSLHEMLTMNAHTVTSIDWVTYPILHFHEVPEVKITLIDRPELGTKGVGEPASMGVGALVGNGIFDATGVRLRTTPFTPDVVKAALA